MGANGVRVAKYPGAMLFTLIARHAAKHDRLPSEVYQDYLAHPRDYRIVWSYESYEAHEEAEELKRIKRDQHTLGKPTEF